MFLRKFLSSDNTKISIADHGPLHSAHVSQERLKKDVSSLAGPICRSRLRAACTSFIGCLKAIIHVEVGQFEQKCIDSKTLHHL